MQRHRHRILTASLLGSGLIAGCAAPDGEPRPAHQAGAADAARAPLLLAPAGAKAVPDEYIVVFDEDAPASALHAAASRIALAQDAGRVRHLYSVIPGFAAELTPQELDALRRNPDVAYIEQDVEISIATETPTDADGIDRADQRELPRDGSYNDHGSDGTGVHVYIIDTGIRTTHHQFTGRVGEGFTSIGDGSVEDCNGHGTHVASTATGTDYGMARKATVHPVRVLNCQGSGTYGGVIAGVDFVRQACAGQSAPCVANMSLGGPSSSSLDQAIAEAVAAGVTMVVAAGNDNANACNYSPAREPSAVTVAAVDDDDAKASFSNYGSCVDLYAPGVSILGAGIGSDTDTQVLSGTSMASPHVAGAAAQYLGDHPDATPEDVTMALEDTASELCVSNNPGGTPNLLLHNDFDAPDFSCDQDDPGQGSCRNRCGQYDDGADCQCDFWCIFEGDCCDDLCFW